MFVRAGLLVSSLALVACGGDEPGSPCYSPAPREYSGTIREFAELPDPAIGVVALRDGKVFAFTVEDERRTGWRIDPSGAVVELGGWDGIWGPMTALADGRVVMVEGGCRSVVIDPSAPGAPTVQACALEDFRAEVVWQAPGGRILMFGAGNVDGDDPHGSVAELDLGAGRASKLDVHTDLLFGAPPERPLQLCDGRVVTATLLHGGDFIDRGDAIHQVDPATGAVTVVELPYRVYDAVQLDTTTALALGYDESDDRALFELDLETGATVAIEASLGYVTQLGRRALVGLADGSALVVAEDGAVNRYLPDQRRIEPLGVAFADLPRALVRVTDGRVLAFLPDGGIEIFE